MNPILQLKGRLNQRANPNRPGKLELPKNSFVKATHIRRLQKQLQDIWIYWKQHTEINGALVSVHYKRVVAKSNRLSILLSYPGHQATDSIRGAKFEWETNQSGEKIQKHVFTHYVPLEAISKAIGFLDTTAAIIEKYYKGQINKEDTDKITAQNFAHRKLIASSNFVKVLRDCWYVERFDIDRVREEVQDERIITIYQTDVDTKQLLARFGIDVVDDRILDGTTIRLYPEEVNQLVYKADYLISMSVTDWSKLTRDDILECEAVEEPDEVALIPPPSNEPIVGVIDTQFDETVYFHEWVQYYKAIDDDIPLKKEDYYHGTAVTSIIVDGPRGNPNLEDGCGHFRVRHFGVATHGAFSSFAVLRQIRNIVSTNRDIKVWNLSLGSALEIKENSISPEGAELDRIQNEFDVIFVVAGTNKPESEQAKMKIGAPADSLNSLVVNSVRFDKNPASYTRVGPVLSFFYKPDISYYGGDGKIGQRIVVCKDSLGASYVTGTSFAAPWITRKVAYLVYMMGLSKEIAKALIIDSAAGWNSRDDLSHTVGYGVVPQHIDDIIHTPDDEIRFILTGTTDSYETYSFNLPVPIVNNAHPFYARATLAYFPQCNRNQGVDYTNTEMDIHFGRVRIKDGKAGIKTIDNNKQADEGLYVIYEEEARQEYRKWDNVKHLCEVVKPNGRARKCYESGMWGLSIKTKERLTNRKKDKLPFGVVVTLKEMNGVNRMDDFIKLCMAHGWLVNQIDVQNQLDIYAKSEEEVIFD